MESKFHSSSVIASTTYKSSAFNQIKFTRPKEWRLVWHISRDATIIANLKARNLTFQLPAACWRFIFKSFQSRFSRRNWRQGLKRHQHYLKLPNKQKNSKHSLSNFRRPIKFFLHGCHVIFQALSIMRSTTNSMLRVSLSCFHQSSRCLTDYWLQFSVMLKRCSSMSNYTSESIRIFLIFLILSRKCTAKLCLPSNWSQWTWLRVKIKHRETSWDSTER